MLISIIVPIWNDVISVPIFIRELFKSVSTHDYEIELIFCVDPSTDGTENELLKICLEHKNIKSLFFDTRVGQGAATFAGLVHCTGNCAIIIDVDLQDPVELIPEMIYSWSQGNAHILPRRISRTGEPLTKRFTAFLGYLFLSKFGSYPIPKNTGDFRLIDREIINKLIRIKERNIFIRGLTAIIDDTPVLIDFRRPERRAGRTKYNKWFGSLRSGINGIISYSNILLELFFYIGSMFAMISFLLSARYIWYKINGVYIPEGLTQLFVALTFIGGVILMGIGILGLYIGRIFDEVKRRPRWTIRNVLNIDKSTIVHDQ
jgi:dolichol-phosphate mannosyltransferase